jgi:hypothetical protein
MPGSCDRCGSPLIQIDHYGDQLAARRECNRWQGDKDAFIVELEVEDWEPLGEVAKLPEIDFTPQEESVQSDLTLELLWQRGTNRLQIILASIDSPHAQAISTGQPKQSNPRH